MRSLLSLDAENLGSDINLRIGLRVVAGIQQSRFVSAVASFGVILFVITWLLPLHGGSCQQPKDDFSEICLVFR